MNWPHWNLSVACCSSLRNVKPWMLAALFVNWLHFFSDWQLILTVVGSVFGAIILVATSLLLVVAFKWVCPYSVSTHSVIFAFPFPDAPPCPYRSPRLLRSKKRSKLSNNVDPTEPYVTTSAAASTFVNIQLPRLPRARTRNSLRPQSNLDANLRDSWRNLAANEEEVVSSCLPGGLRYQEMGAHWMLNQ